MRRLRPYQQAVLRYLLSRDAAYLAMDMRLGKTLPVVRWLRARRCARVLVLAPYSALYGWMRELELEGIDHNHIYLCSGTAQARYAMLESCLASGGWLLLNKEGHRVIPIVASAVWDAIVLDEATFAKNPRADVVRWLRTFPRRAGQARVALSGTPAPEGPGEWFEQLHFLDPKWLGFDNYWEFRAAWFTQPIGEEGRHRWIITTHGKRLLEQALARNVYFLSRADVGLEPKKIYMQRLVRLPDATRKCYETAEREFVLEVQGQEIASTTLATVSFVWLRRIAGGAGMDADTPQRDLVHYEKLNALYELLNGELHRQQVIIWASLLTEIRMVGRGLGRTCVVVHGDIAPAERDAAAQAFQRGAVQYFVAQPECFKHGVDLSAATAMIYYSSPMGLETRAQTEDRFVDLRRQQSGLLIIDLITEGTVDENIYWALRAKRHRADFARDIIRGIQTRAATYR